MIIFAHKIEEGNEFDRANITMTIPNDDITLDDLIPEIERFLIAVGYRLSPGRHLDIVGDDK